MSLFLSTALSIATRAAARVLGFSVKAWAVAKDAVASAETTYGSEPGKGDAKYKLALTALLSVGLKISPQWAGILVELAWLLFEATGWPKKEAK